MKEDPTMAEVKAAAKQAGIIKRRLVDLSVADVIEFLIKLEEGEKK